MKKKYSIVKDSSADFGVNFKIVQNQPTIKAVHFQRIAKLETKIFFFKICQAKMDHCVRLATQLG